MDVVKLIEPTRHGDARGWFSEVWVEERWRAWGVDCRFVQDNHSYSAAPFTMRGLHFQTPPRALAKLVRCVRGRIFDAAVDVRAGSPSYCRWVGSELSAANGRQIFVPQGFAHGFLTLSLLSRMAASVMLVPETTVMAVNYGFERVRFVEPVPSCSRVRGRFTLKAAQAEGARLRLTHTVTVDIEGRDRPALLADWIGLIFLSSPSTKATT